MVQLIYGMKKGETIPGEAVGLTPPSSYIASLLDFSAKLDKKDLAVGKEKAKETSGPETEIARKVKALSLFPSIYDAVPEKAPKAHFDTGSKKTNHTREKKQEEKPRDSELMKKKPLKL